MMKQQRCFLIVVDFILLSYILALSFPQNMVFAATTGQISGEMFRRYPLSGEDNNAQEVLLSGPIDSHEIEVFIPATTRLSGGSYISLQVSHSPLLLAERSVLTVYLDDKPLDSLKLDASNKNFATVHFYNQSKEKGIKATGIGIE
jgi:hypothetical protein